MDFVLAAETAGGTAADNGGYWQLALILAAIGFMGLFARWRKARMPPLRTAKEIRDRDTDPNRYRDAADKAIVELLETSRVLNAQVDTKIRVLNRLVKDAEEECARLEKLLAAARGATPETIAPQPPEPPPAAAEEPKEPERPKFLSELHERLHRLKSEGMTVEEIARATNLSTTEAEFMIRSLPGGE